MQNATTTTTTTTTTSFSTLQDEIDLAAHLDSGTCLNLLGNFIC